MKKILTAMALVGAMSVSAICAAAGEGTILNKNQKAADSFTSALTGAEVPFNTVSATFAPTLKAGVTEEAFKELQKKVKTQLGTAKEINFREFEYAQNGSRLTYVCSFSKENNVILTYIFNPQNKIVNFALNPVKPAPAQAAQPQK